jgi:large subunit ribosomal protein L15
MTWGVSRRAPRVTVESLPRPASSEAHKPVKLLANGRIEQAVVVRGLKVSAGARDKIVAAGGRVEE